jgi:hypothetical protein
MGISTLPTPNEEQTLFCIAPNQLLHQLGAKVPGHSSTQHFGCDFDKSETLHPVRSKQCNVLLLPLGSTSFIRVQFDFSWYVSSNILNSHLTLSKIMVFPLFRMVIARPLRMETELCSNR